jgi:hypothetical protein
MSDKLYIIGGFGGPHNNLNLLNDVQVSFEIQYKDN